MFASINALDASYPIIVSSSIDSLNIYLSEIDKKMLF